MIDLVLLVLLVICKFTKFVLQNQLGDRATANMVSTANKSLGAPLDFRIAWSQVNHYVSMLLVLAAITLVGADEMADTEMTDTNPNHATPRGLDATVDPDHGGRKSRNVVAIRRGLDAIASKLLERDATSAPVNDVDTVSSIPCCSHSLQRVNLLAYYSCEQVVAENTDSSQLEQVTREVTDMLQSGQDNSACEDAAQALIDSAISKAEEITKILAGLPTGDKCPEAGQTAVQNAKRLKEIASENSKEREVEYALAQEAKAKADKDLEKAHTARSEAAVEEKDADVVATEAVQAAEVEVKSCQCKAKAAYENANAAATEHAADDEAAYTKGKHMLCVLRGVKDLAECKVGPIPKPTQIELASGTSSAECKEATTAQISGPPDSCASCELVPCGFCQEGCCHCSL